MVAASRSLRILIKQKSKRTLTFHRRWKHNKIMTYTGFMEQVEADCNRCCHIPKIPKRKVTVVGAGSPVGRIVSLFLKQPPVVETLCLYDSVADHRVIGLATDLAHIDTSPQIEAYQGRVNLKKALKVSEINFNAPCSPLLNVGPLQRAPFHRLHVATNLQDAEVVVVCGGVSPTPPDCAADDERLFLRNMTAVRATAFACSQFCPEAFLAIAVPPVDCTFTMVAHVLKQLGTLDRRRVIGVNSIASMRATSLLASLTGQDPGKTIVPVVCGCGRRTIVPVFSACKANFPQGQTDCLVKLVREADEIIGRVKGDGGQAHLSTGYAVARCVFAIMTGLFEKPTFIDSALVWQDKPDMSYGLEICACTLTVGAGGIVQYGIPQLSAREQELLQRSRPDMDDRIGLARYWATGERFVRSRRPDKSTHLEKSKVNEK